MTYMHIHISPPRVESLLRGPARQVAVRFVEETGSTNTDLLDEAASLATPVLLVAERQTGGRGRAGRAWHSAPGASLTFSLAWRFDAPLHTLIGLPLAVGVALAEVLATFEVPVRLKWPNDVLYEGRKLAGILIETAADPARQANWAVIGTGINMTVDAALAADIGRPVAAAPRLAELDRDLLLASLLNGLAEAMMQFSRQGLGAFLTRWNDLHAYAGQQVVILDHGKVLHQGIAVGVDGMGRFLLDTAGGQVAVMAGDVSLRIAGEGV